MLPIQILDDRDYKIKFQQALEYSMQQNHQNALNLLLELKRKRWKKFELSYQIANEFVYLQNYTEALQELVQAVPQTEHEKQQKKNNIFYIQVLIYLKELTVKDKIFDETTSLKLLYLASNQIKNKKTLEDCHINYKLGLNVETNRLLKQIFGINFEQINRFTKEQIQQACFLLISSEDYISSIQILHSVDNTNEDSSILYAKGYCYQKMKNYREAHNYFQKLFSQERQIKNYLSLYQNSYLMHIQFDQGEYQTIPFFDIFFMLHMQIYQFDKPLQVTFSMFSKDSLLKYIEYLMQDIIISKNTKIYLYQELFFAIFYLHRENPQLQKICDHMLKYSPQFAGGYQCQYTLYMQQQQQQKLMGLIDPLLDCEECSLKYIILANIYIEKQQYQLSHQFLDQSMKINKFNSEIYQVRIKLYQLQKNYILAYQTMKSVIELENQNYIFVNSIVAKLINEYQYYRAVELLELTDKENQKFQQYKTLLKILSINQQNNDNELLTEIEQLNTPEKYLFYGHYWLRKNEIGQALEFYELCVQEKIIDYSQLDEIQLKLTQQIQQYQINDIICKMSLINYEYQVNDITLIKRYIQTLGYALSLFVFPEQQQEIVEFINNNYDMTVSKIENYHTILLENIQKLYKLEGIALEKYTMYMNKTLKQLLSLFLKFDQFLITFYNYCNQNQEEILKSVIERNHQPYGLDSDIQIIYDYPFFSDPISRCALFKVVKMIGYFNQFELDNDYKILEEWLHFYILAPHIDENFKAILKKRIIIN